MGTVLSGILPATGEGFNAVPVPFVYEGQAGGAEMGGVGDVELTVKDW